MGEPLEERKGRFHLTHAYWGPRRKPLTPVAQAENGVAPSLQLISNYVSESLGTAGGKGGTRKHKENKNKIFHQRYQVVKASWKTSGNLRKKFDLALLWIWHQFMQNF